MANRYWVGGSGTWDGSNTANWSTTSGGAGGASVPTNVDAVLIDSLSGSGIIVVASGAACLSISHTSSTYNLSFGLNFSVPDTVTFIRGTLTLNNNILTCGVFYSYSSQARTLVFGTGSINVTGTSGTVVSFNTADNFGYTGTSAINLTASTGVGTRTVYFGNITGATEANVVNINVIAGSDTVNLLGSFKSVNFTGFSGVLAGATKSVYGDLIISSGMTVAFSTLTTSFRATSGVQRITTNGVSFNQRLTVNGTGNLTQLQDAFTSNQRVTLTAGTFDLNSNAVSCQALYVTGTTTRALANTSAGVTLIGSGVIFSGATTTGLTFPVTNITLSDTSTTARTFTGGGLTFGSLTFTGSNVCTTIISGNNIFGTISSSKTSACAVTLEAASITTVSNWNLSGTVGNVVTLNSSVAGTQATISQSSGTVSVSYNTIQDINATGGAIFDALTTNGNTDAGNNLGWTFGLDELTETVTLSESLVATISTQNSLAESTTVSDSQAAIGSFRHSITESETLSDTQTGTGAGASSISEGLAVSDSFRGGYFYSNSLTDIQTLSDVQTSASATVVSLSETTTLTSSESGGIRYPNTIAETQTLTDVSVFSVAFITTVSEYVTMTEAISGGYKFNAVVLEPVMLTDQYLNRGWYALDDSQTETWGPITTYNYEYLAVQDSRAIPNNVFTTRNSVNLGNNTGWMFVNTGWGTINDAQNPNWGPVDDTQQ